MVILASVFFNPEVKSHPIILRKGVDEEFPKPEGRCKGRWFLFNHILKKKTKTNFCDCGSFSWQGTTPQVVRSITLQN